MKYKLELEEEEYCFEGWAFVHFHTMLPGYALANSLNQLYEYRLERLDDMPLDDANWPLYRYEDTWGKLLFFLIERPSTTLAAPWDTGDKVLIIKGENSAAAARNIFSDFTGTPEVAEGDLLAREHVDVLNELLSSFTVVNLMDFEAQPTSRKAIKERAVVQEHCDKILAYIEQKHLDLSDEERWRLEITRGV